jgi:hypothetical protein
MSHLFISYSHKDKIQRDQLLTYLKSNGFSDKDVWCDDKDIDGGDYWRQSIDTALEESFAVVVILTENSIQSHYVTYEWSCALGKGAKIIPLSFEKFSLEMKYPLLDFIQCKYFHDEINKGLAAKVLEIRKESPIAVDFNREISEITMPLRILTRFSIWLYQFDRGKGPDMYFMEDPDRHFQTYLDKAANEAWDLRNDKLKGFHDRDKTTKQKRYYQEIIECIEELKEKLSHLRDEVQFLFGKPNYVSQIDELVEDLKNYRLNVFEVAIRHFQYRENYFYLLFDDYLDNYSQITDQFTIIHSKIILTRLPDDEIKSISGIIERYIGK